jgi:hypothetical protein
MNTASFPLAFANVDRRRADNQRAPTREAGAEYAPDLALRSPKVAGQENRQGAKSIALAFVSSTTGLISARRP